MKVLLIVLGGGTGSLARYLVGTAIMTRFGARFPWGTLLINVTGSFLIGLLMTLLTRRAAPSTNLLPLLVVGFLGGYTTFSSFEWETFSSVQSGGFWMGAINVIASVGLGYTAVWLGALAGRQ